MRRRAFAWAAIGVTVTSLIILAVVTIVWTTTVVGDIREAQRAGIDRAARDRVRDEQTAAAARDAARSVDRIEDCTTPGRECFERNSRATSDAVAGINQGTLAVIVAALSCQADDVVDQRALARCTARRAQASSRPPAE